MKDLDDIPVNSMMISMHLLKDGTLKTAFGHNFDVKLLDEDEIQYLLDVLNGIRLSLDASMEQFAQQGAMARTINDLIKELDEGPLVGFEPDEEFLETVREKQSNVIQFNKKKIH